MSYIRKIRTTLPNSEKVVDIDLEGRNLILTGGNGCGKTQLVNYLYQNLERMVIKRENRDEQQLLPLIASNEKLMKEVGKTTSIYTYYEKNVNNYRRELEETKNCPLVLDNIEQFITRFSEHEALCFKFDAIRQANIKESKSSVSKADLIKQADSNDATKSAATLFEEYLISHKTEQAYAESPSIDNDPTKAKKIANWFEKLKDDFRELFEDATLQLQFNSQSQSFFIVQSNKAPYRFQQLSSGFSSILAVYADLLTRVELRSIDPNEIDGVVFVDEIDAHLHVSLQRKIFSFLDKAFPKVQFIVTTHSPFVVSSVNNAVIYDLSHLEQVEDMSMYSYESVLEGLFGVLPISEVLKRKIIKISELNQSTNPDIDKLTALVSQLDKYEEKLDSESAYFLKMAKTTINKSPKKRSDV